MDSKRKLEGKARPSPGPVVKRNPLRTLLFEECYKILRIEDVGIFKL